MCVRKYSMLGRYVFDARRNSNFLDLTQFTSTLRLKNGEIPVHSLFNLSVFGKAVNSAADMTPVTRQLNRKRAPPRDTNRKPVCAGGSAKYDSGSRKYI